MNHLRTWETDNVSTNTLSLQSATMTQGGKRRVNNRDAVFEHTTRTPNGNLVGLYIVCDGFGNDQAEYSASQMTVQIIANKLVRVFAENYATDDPTVTQPTMLTVRDWLKAAVSYANRKVWAYNQSLIANDEPTIGTTLTLALIYGNEICVANIGDSRTYLWREGKLAQITQDHSWVSELVRQGIITEDAAHAHPQKNVISRALGLEASVKADIFEGQLQPGDKLLLCTDGLWKSFPDTAELSDWLSTTDAPEELCQHLMAEAIYRDNFDDIGLVQVHANLIDGSELPTKHIHSPLFAPTAVPAPIVLIS